MNYPYGYPGPLCDMMIVLLVLDDLVTLPDLPSLENKEERTFHEANLKSCGGIFHERA